MGRLCFTLAIALSASLLPAPAAALDLALYASLLERHTEAVADPAGTRVDYAGLRASADWPRLVASLEAARPERLADREARLAFWINAYNVLAIDTLVEGGPVGSIRELGSFFRSIWKKRAGRVGTRDVSLDEIEHAILRRMGEPRIHVAIVCASTSCPSLLREPFRGDVLEAQLEERARSFLADPRKGMHVDRASEDVHVSKIFDWFRKDFEPAGGVIAFLLEYAPEGERAWLAEHADAVDLVSLDYDWRVNALPGRE